MEDSHTIPDPNEPSSLGEGVKQAPWVSPDVLEARQGGSPAMGKTIEDNPNQNND